MGSDDGVVLSIVEENTLSQITEHAIALAPLGVVCNDNAATSCATAFLRSWVCSLLRYNQCIAGGLAADLLLFVEIWIHKF